MSSSSSAHAALSEPEAGGLISSNLYLLLDDEKEWSAFGHPCQISGESTHVLEENVLVWESFVVLQGMHCAACALNIEEALQAVPGVLSAEVSATTQRAKVRWRRDIVLPSVWTKAVERAGYGVLPALDVVTREARIREARKALWRWLVAGFCMMQVMMYAWPAYTAQPGDLSMEMEHLLRWASWVLSLPVVCFACGPFFSAAWRDLRTRQVSMDFPVALGMALTFITSSLGTFDPSGVFGEEVYYDSLTMFVFFLLTGRWVELRLRDKTAGALEALFNRMPENVERQSSSGAWERVATRRLQMGDVIRVLPGEAFPADGVVLDGQTTVDESLLTGESTPVYRTQGDAVISGSYNLGAVVQLQITRIGSQTRFGEIVAMMEQAVLQKPRLAQLADRIARPFLFGVLLAALVALLMWWHIDIGKATMVAVAVLIVTCPCALSLATPVAMLSAAGTLARHGVLVRNLQAIETLARVNTVVFDKTGTLTRDGMVLETVQSLDSAWSTAAVQELAASLARYSLHPVSKAVVAATKQSGNLWEISEVKELPGLGLTAWMMLSGSKKTEVLLGSAAHMGCALPSEYVKNVLFGPELFLGVRNEHDEVQVLAGFSFKEDMRPEAPLAIDFLQKHNIQVVLLSGDQPANVSRMAQVLGIKDWQAQCTPNTKLKALRKLQSQGRVVAMVGDGINDGPVLAGADVSFAFGQSVALTQSRADFVVLGSQLNLVPQSWLLALKTMRIVKQNLAWSVAYNASGIPLAFAGYMPPWLAGLGMALSSLLVVMNSARLAQSLPPLRDNKDRPIDAEVASAGSVGVA